MRFPFPRIVQSPDRQVTLILLGPGCNDSSAWGVRFIWSKYNSDASASEIACRDDFIADLHVSHWGWTRIL